MIYRIDLVRGLRTASVVLLAVPVLLSVGCSGRSAQGIGETSKQPAKAGSPTPPARTLSDAGRVKSRVKALPEKVYTCGDAGAISHPHCYAVADWDSLQRRVGFFSADISLVDLEAERNQFLDDELWLVDKSCKYGCWIEAGIMSDHTSSFSGPVYFWAVGLPNGSVRVSYFGPVDRHHYGKIAHIELSSNGSVFRARIVPPGGSAYYSSGNVNVSMKPSIINLGQELSGTSGSHAPRAQFLRIHAGVASPGNLLRSTGKVSVNNPPFGGWQVKPAPRTDGIFYTQCC